MKIILASKSPRRREILSSLGLSFEILSADADESSSERDPLRLAEELSLRKGRATRDLLVSRGEWNDDTLVIAADTVVVRDEEILGKPKDESDAVRMLRSLSGNTHSVVSGVSLLYGERETAAAEQTTVVFSRLSDEDLLRYVRTGEPMDKAGAYAVQGLASMWIEGIRGDYFSVVGLPVHRLNELLREFLGKELLDL